MHSEAEKGEAATPSPSSVDLFFLGQRSLWEEDELHNRLCLTWIVVILRHLHHELTRHSRETTWPAVALQTVTSHKRGCPKVSELV